MFTKLPTELLEHALRFCSISDKQNIACCNKEHSSLMEPILWKSVKVIPENVRSYVSNSVLDKLCHTTALRIYSDSRPSSAIIDQLTLQEKIVNYGYNLSQILSKVNPLIISRLTLHGVLSDFCFVCIMRKLHLVEDLRLYDVNLVDVNNWRTTPTQIKSLALIRCTITDHALEEILEKNPLTDLCVNACHRLTHASLVNISNKQSIRRFGLKICSVSGGQSADVDIRCISAMKELTFLCLNGFVLQPEHMTELWQSLKQLKVLELKDLFLSNVGFDQIQQLCSLKKLTIIGCSGASNSCFHQIKLLPALTCFVFDCGLLSAAPELYGDVALLNNMKELKLIIIKMTVENTTSSGVHWILRALCMEKKWILQVALQNYIFHKVS